MRSELGGFVIQEEERRFLEANKAISFAAELPSLLVQGFIIRFDDGRLDLERHGKRSCFTETKSFRHQRRHCIHLLEKRANSSSVIKASGGMGYSSSSELEISYSSKYKNLLQLFWILVRVTVWRPFETRLRKELGQRKEPDLVDGGS